jgi:hypothetical protein
MASTNHGHKPGHLNQLTTPKSGGLLLLSRVETCEADLPSPVSGELVAPFHGCCNGIIRVLARGDEVPFSARTRRSLPNLHFSVRIVNSMELGTGVDTVLRSSLFRVIPQEDVVYFSWAKGSPCCSKGGLRSFGTF